MGTRAKSLAKERVLPSAENSSELLVKHRESQSPFVLVFPDPLVSLIVRKRHS